MTKIIHLVAVNSNWGIGNNGGIPWKCQEDMAHFASTTANKTLVMGRKTFDSLPDSFYAGDREIFVLSRNPDKGMLMSEIAFATQNIKELYICGGADAYEAFPADEIILSEINDDAVCDTFYKKPSGFTIANEQKLSAKLTIFNLSKRAGGKELTLSCPHSVDTGETASAYDDKEVCPDCGGQNTIIEETTEDGHLAECKTGCLQCGEHNYWIRGHFVSEPPMTLDELAVNVELWSKNKGLDKVDPRGQFLKVVEEVGEVAAAMARDDRPELIDGIGDVMVTLIILAQQHGLEARTCLQTAYDVIAKRKGKTVNGVFIKDEE